MRCQDDGVSTKQLVFLLNLILLIISIWPARGIVTSYELCWWWIAKYYASERTILVICYYPALSVLFIICWPISYIYPTGDWLGMRKIYETFENISHFRLTAPETSTRCRRLDPPCPPVPREATPTLCPLTSWTLPWGSRPGGSSSPCMPWGDNRPGLSYRAGECQYYCWLAGNVDCNYCSE